MIDLSRWPEVTVNNVTVTVPLPRVGKPGHHVCETARNECADCKLARAAQDEILRARMLDERMSAAQYIRPPKMEAWTYQ